MNHMMKCHYCQKSFRAFRVTARFCSDSCRVSYSQLPRRFQEKAGNSWAGMKDIVDLATRFPEKLDEAEKQMEWLQLRILDMKWLLADLRHARKTETT